MIELQIFFAFILLYQDVIVIVLGVLFSILLVAAMYAAFTMPTGGGHIHWHGDVNPNCSDCHGTGMMPVQGYPDDPVDCPCRMRIEH